MAPRSKTLRLLKAQSTALLLMVSMLLLFNSNVAQAQSSAGNFRITSVELTNFRIDGNVLRADGTVSGTLAGLPFTTDITNFALQPVQDDPNTCSILNLELGPIDLDLLGLHVNTSAICLEITGTEGGGLLGDLLCGLAGGGPLGGPVLPTPAQVNPLEQQLVNILNRALGRDPSPAQVDPSVCEGECVILELALGPLDLTLLGLNVFLDDCEGGPVQICVSASEGQGLLGDLLCGLTGNQLGNLTLADIARLATTALALLNDGSLSESDIAVLTRLLNQLVQ